MAESVAPRRPALKSQILTFLTVFTGLLAVLHFWILFIITENFSLPMWANLLLGIVFLAGVFCMPIGYRVSRQSPKSSYYFLAWYAYLWLGFFFIALWVSSLYFLLKIWIDSPYLGLTQVWSAILVLFAWSVFNGVRDPQIENEKNPLDKKMGLKIAQITDLHVGLLRHDRAWLQRIVDKLNASGVDMVVLTGDLVEGPWENVRPLLEPLANVKAPLGNIFVSGNHEFIHGGEIWEEYLATVGWKILNNDHIVFDHNGKKWMVAGVPDRMVAKRGSDPDQALKTNSPVDFKILLAHEPASVLDLKKEKPDVILSGHTHGGQIFPFLFLVRLAQPVVEGWKKIKDVWVYAHPGTGLWGPPMRLGTRHKISVFEF